MLNSMPKAVRWCTGLIAAVCALGLATPAVAQVDCNNADLQDLIDYIAGLEGEGCGLDIADAAGDISVNDPNFDPCDPAFTPGVSTYFVNGFDQIRTLIALDDGDLYLGMRVVGEIGDADGNGDPDNNNCTDSVNINDEAGIGVSESYTWFLDTNCDGVTDISVTVNNNAVQVSGASPSGTSFEFSGSDLKVCLFDVNIGPFFEARSFAGHLFDGLGEDLSAVARCDEPLLAIDVEKTVGDVCPGDDTTVNVTVTNTGNAELDPVEIEDTLPAGFTYVGGSSSIGEPGIAGQVLSWSEGPLAPGEVLAFSFQITAPSDCANPLNLIEVSGAFSNPCVGDGQTQFAVDADEYQFECTPCGEACPRTIGFWRQQCAQKLNGSTKVCLEGMYSLWRCVIDETGVTSWLENDGSSTSTAAYQALSDADLFAALCSQLDGPRPMTLHNMAEIQYLGLMLNVCSGALPLGTVVDNGFDGTVAEAIEEIEDAINSGAEDLGYWKDVADDINNRIGILAADCDLDLFRNIEPCGEDAGQLLNPAVSPNELRVRAYPNPVMNRGGITVQYDIPSQLGEGKVEISIFDVSGRKVRTLDNTTRTPGSYSVSWDLRDASGREVPAGIYFYRLQTPAEQKTQRLIVVQR